MPVNTRSKIRDSVDILSGNEKTEIQSSPSSSRVNTRPNLEYLGEEDVQQKPIRPKNKRLQQLQKGASIVRQQLSEDDSGGSMTTQGPSPFSEIDQKKKTLKKGNKSVSVSHSDASKDSGRVRRRKKKVSFVIPQRAPVIRRKLSTTQPKSVLKNRSTDLETNEKKDPTEQEVTTIADKKTVVKTVKIATINEIPVEVQPKKPENNNKVNEGTTLSNQAKKRKPTNVIGVENSKLKIPPAFDFGEEPAATKKMTLDLLTTQLNTSRKGKKVVSNKLPESFPVLPLVQETTNSTESEVVSSQMKKLTLSEASTKPHSSKPKRNQIETLLSTSISNMPDENLVPQVSDEQRFSSLRVGKKKTRPAVPRPTTLMEDQSENLVPNDDVQENMQQCSPPKDVTSQRKIAKSKKKVETVRTDEQEKVARPSKYTFRSAWRFVSQEIGWVVSSCSDQVDEKPKDDDCVGVKPWCSKDFV